jgi:hypothetical protein
MATCTFPGCGRKMHAKGLCGGHYSQWKYGSGEELRPLQGDLAGPDSCHREGWVPPSGLSPAWHASMKRGSQPAATREQPCALEACGGVAQHGSDLCPAHHHYRATQVRQKAERLARGLA